MTKMKKNRGKHGSFEKLRRQAEMRLLARDTKLSKIPSKDKNELIHELGVHQLELEMQNEELRHTQIELAESRDKYHELYDFAPIGYFISDNDHLYYRLNPDAITSWQRRFQITVGRE